jgi:L-threonylcarbamoyladenylate synthase
LKITRVKGTPLLRVNPDKPKAADIRWAAAVLLNGGVVAIPTDTVYGLAADARNPSALKRLYSLKGREPRKPLACLIAYREQMLALSGSVPEKAWELGKAHWPGALTLIVPKAPWVPEVLTSGGPSVGLRYPNCAWNWELIEALGWPIAATSANLSGTPAAYEGSKVVADWAGKLDLIVDGGRCKTAVESTVALVSGSKVQVLRQGALDLKL